MDLLTEPVLKDSPAADAPRAEAPRTAAQWLDALSTGTCDQPAFFEGVSQLLRRAPDTGWELLALIDQYYRRGRLTAEAFGTLKTHLQDWLMGTTGDAEGGRRGARNRSFRAAPARAFSPTTLSTVALSSLPQVPAAPGVDRARLAPPPEPEDDLDSNDDYFDAGSTHRTEPAVRSLAAGDVLRARYRVRRVLGQGGMGTVFEAIDEFRLGGSNGDQRVAIKVLHTAVIQRPRLFAELRREFQHLQSLSHPNIVRVHEFDRDGGLAFFTMELLSGALLSRVLSAHPASPLPRPYALAMIRDVGAAVAHAHAHGIVHGDLNPGNIFITDEGELRVLDFGASHRAHEGPHLSSLDEQPAVVPVATPTYASCQLLQGEPADVRDDLYALACVAYILLAGRHPFREQTALKARSARLKPARPGGLTGSQWHALRAGLNFEREHRPRDVRAWLRAMDTQAVVAKLPPLPTLFKTPPPRRRIMPWAVAAAAAALLAGCGWWAVMTYPGLAANAWATLHADLQSILPAVQTPRVTTAAAVGTDSTRLPDAAPVAVESAPAPPPPVADIPRGAAREVPAAAVPAIRAGSATGATAGIAAPPAHGLADTVAPTTTPGLRARIELATDTVDVGPDESVARIVLHRSRLLRGDVGFKWWTESGTAKPGRDFVVIKPQVEQFPNGKATLTLLVPVVVDSRRRDARSFYVVIDAAGEDAAVGPRTLTMVTLPGADSDDR